MDQVDAKTRETAATLLDVLWTSKVATGPAKLPKSSPTAIPGSINSIGNAAVMSGVPGEANTGTNTGSSTGSTIAPAEITLRHGFYTKGWGNDTIIQPQIQTKNAPMIVHQHEIASELEDATKLPKQQQQQQQSQLASSIPVVDSGSISITPAINLPHHEQPLRHPIQESRFEQQAKEPQNQIPSKNFPQNSFLGVNHTIPPSAIHLTSTTTTTTPMRISMTSVGFGIDPNHMSWVDATEAAVKAVQDAMERSTLRFHTFHTHSLQIKIRLGVPCIRSRGEKNSNRNPKQQQQTMSVDLTRLSNILPRDIPILSIQLEPGGLLVPGDTPGAPSICTVVACIALESQPQSLSPSSVPKPPPNTVLPKDPVVAPPLPPCPPLVLEGATASGLLPPPQPTLAIASKKTPALSSREYSVVGGTKITGNDSNLQQKPPTDKSRNKRKLPASENDGKGATKSIEILAMISEHEINRRKSLGTNVPSVVVARTTPPPRALPSIAPLNCSATSSTSATTGNSLNLGSESLPPISRMRNPATRKPASVRQPQITSGRHRVGGRNASYSDYSNELPLPEERDCWAISTKTISTPVFPLKLHVTLTQIEKDGLDDIIGWLPHGRSFKIHKQKEFTEIILPRYFVMTKKSSFLRQLNLYSFNRFSAGTTDKGSYYHEKFLRGRKFLSRRMTRQKVNGNRIRSAGNPDEEPDLSMYPICRDDDDNTKHHLAPASNSSAALLATTGATGRAIVSTYH